MSSDPASSGAAGSNEDTYGELPEEPDTFDANPPPLKRGGVRFPSAKSMEQVKRISRASLYNSDEIKDYWGTSTDKIMQKTELKRDVLDMYLKSRESDSDFTKLGIDTLAGKGKEKKKSNRMVSRHAVLDEQDLQEHEGVHDDKLLAGVYSVTSRKAKKDARKKAEQLHASLAEE